MRAWIALAGVVCLSIVAYADETRPGSPEIHYSPVENLERIDVAVLDRATRTIDLAAYVLTDRPIVEALVRAARRGVVVRIYRNKADDRYDDNSEVKALPAEPGISVRRKASRVFMHLKSYAVDGRWLRSGAANFTPTGLKRQDNDLVLFDDSVKAQAFTRNFETLWAGGEPETQPP